MKALLTWILGIAVTVVCTPAHGCSCVHNTLEHSIQFTDAIVSGKFIRGQNLWELSKEGKGAPILYYTGMFVVTEVLKGNNIKVGDTLQETSDFTNCSTLFKQNMNYLLFASSDNRNIKSDICSYSGILEENKTKKTLKQTKRLIRKRLLT